MQEKSPTLNKQINCYLCCTVVVFFENSVSIKLCTILDGFNPDDDNWLKTLSLIIIFPRVYSLNCICTRKKQFCEFQCMLDQNRQQNRIHN